MQRLSTPEILLNQGLSDLPTIHAPIGSVKEIENFLVTERGLVKRPGIKHVADINTLDIDPSNFRYLNSQLLNVDGKNYFVFFFYNEITHVVHAFLYDTETYEKKKEIQIQITNNSTAAISEEISQARLIYTENNQFVFYSNNSYIKATYATTNDALLPPQNWVLLESTDYSDIYSINATQGKDYLQLQVALLGTPYLITWKYTAQADETVGKLFDQLNAFRAYFLDVLSRQLHYTDPESETFHTIDISWQETIVDTNSIISGAAIFNRVVDTSIELAPSDVIGFDGVTNLNDAGEETIIQNIQTGDIYQITNWSSIDIYRNTTNETVQLKINADIKRIMPNGATEDLSELIIDNIWGVEFVDASANLSANNVRFIFKKVFSEEQLPNGVPGLTVEFQSLEGYPKIYHAVSTGTLLETPLFVSKEIFVNSQNIENSVWDMKINYGLKQIVFYNYTVFEADLATDTTVYTQDQYISLVRIPTDIAKYIIAPVIVNSFIKDVYYYQGRIGILTSNGITFSSVNNYFDFIKRRVEIILDTDPIDLALDGDMLFIKPFDKYLVLFGRYKQHLLTWEGFFSLRTIAVTEISHYELSNTEPVLVNNSLIFLDANRNLLEFYTVVTRSLPKAFKISHYHIPENIEKLVPVSSLNSIIGFTSSFKTGYVVYVPPIDKLENLYRPLSKFSFKIAAEPLGEVDNKFFFIKYRQTPSVMLQIGYIDTEIISKMYSDLLEGLNFMAVDWLQESSSISHSCSGTKLQYSASFNLDFPDKDQMTFWLQYPETTFLIEKVLDENIEDLTDNSVIITDANYECIYDEASSTFIIPSSEEDELATKVYAGIPVTAKVKFEPIPIAEKPLAIEKYTLVVLRLLLYGLPVTINFYRTEKDTLPFFSHSITGQIIDLDYFDIWDYRTQSYKLRQPLNAHGLVEAISEAPDPLIIYSYQAIFNIYERGL